MSSKKEIVEKYRKLHKERKPYVGNSFQSEVIGIISTKEQITNKIDSSMSSIELKEDTSTPSTDYVLNVMGKEVGRINIPFDKVIKDASYDSVTKKVVLTVDNGEADGKKIEFSVADMISTYVGDDENVKVEGNKISITDKLKETINGLKANVAKLESEGQTTIDEASKQLGGLIQTISTTLTEKIKANKEAIASSETKITEQAASVEGKADKASIEEIKSTISSLATTEALNAKTSELDGKISTNTTAIEGKAEKGDVDTLKEVVKGFVTSEAFNTKIAEVEGKITSSTSNPNSAPVDTEPLKSDINQIKESLNNKVDNSVIANYATTESLTQELAKKANIEALNDYATTSFVNEELNKKISSDALSTYATKEELETVKSSLAQTESKAEGAKGSIETLQSEFNGFKESNTQALNSKAEASTLTQLSEKVNTLPTTETVTSEIGKVEAKLAEYVKEEALTEKISQAKTEVLSSVEQKYISIEGAGQILSSNKSELEQMISTKAASETVSALEQRVNGLPTNETLEQYTKSEVLTSTIDSFKSELDSKFVTDTALISKIDEAKGELNSTISNKVENSVFQELVARVEKLEKELAKFNSAPTSSDGHTEEHREENSNAHSGEHTEVNTEGHA